MQNYNHIRMLTYPFYTLGLLRWAISLFMLVYAASLWSQQATNNVFYHKEYEYAIIKKTQSPQSIADQKKSDIKQFVQKESIKFKSLLHPSFTNKGENLSLNDWVFKHVYHSDSLKIKQYRYDPEFYIQSFKVNNWYYRNLFEVTLKDRFIENEHTQNNIPDTVYSLSEKKQMRNLFGNKHDKYVIYYCDKTDSLRIVGGNAFLKELEPAWFLGIDDNSALVTHIRLSHLTGVEDEIFSTNTTSEEYASDKDTFIMLNKDRKRFIRLFGSPAYKKRKDSRFPDHTYVKLPYTGVATPRDAMYMGWEEIDGSCYCEPWDSIEYYRYINAEHMESLMRDWQWDFPYEKGFMFYEIKNVVIANPTSFSDVIPHIRGLPSDEEDRMRKSPLKFYLGVLKP